MVKAWILNIGDEVLSGKVINTNASDIAIFLSKYNIIVERIVIVSDDEKNISEILNQFINSSSDFLITTGGLGPTHDDLTKEVIAKFFNRSLAYNAIAETDMFKYFHENKYDCNTKQLYFPEDAIIISNSLGSADGFIIEIDNKAIISLVGVPYEMNNMLNYEVSNYFKKYSEDMLLKEYYLMGNSEAGFEEMLTPIISKYPDINITLYCSIENIRLQVSTSANNKDFVGVNDLIMKLLNKYIISNNKTTIEELVVEKLKNSNYHVSCAESCTGGLLASTIINVSGASSVIKESYIAYANEIKEKLFKVKEETIFKYGVVSGETVMEMVEGLYQMTKSQVCISVSGNAGDGLEPGLIFFAIKFNDDIIVQKKQFHGSRNIVRLRAVKYILYQLYLLLEGKN